VSIYPSVVNQALALPCNDESFPVQAANPTASDVEIFLTEVRTLSKLHHRNIVQFYGACLDPDRAMFFVTELMKGGDLYSALRHHPETMRWDKLGKKVALDVALGINYLHTRRPPLLHRDLKSPNVLLSEEGVAKIADVGMVRSQVKELVTAQPVMTPLWAAPEVCSHLPRPRQLCNALYSLGCDSAWCRIASLCGRQLLEV
jgi:serine/threonine protein kinase